MPRTLRRIALATSVSVIAACGDPGKLRLGAICGESAQCESGLCADGTCVDPAADSDGDGLTNGFEAVLGSDTALVDTDGDGITDPAELDAARALVDTDGDAKPDILESATRDADGDCITDQFDAEDATPNTDLSPMIAAVCPSAGICGVQRDALRAACPDGARAVCVFSDVSGYADPEVACNGADDDCDGRVDEGVCAAPAEPFVSVDSGGRTVATGRYRATLVLGPPALSDTRTARHRALVGSNPALAPMSPQPEVP